MPGPVEPRSRRHTGHGQPSHSCRQPLRRLAADTWRRGACTHAPSGRTGNPAARRQRATRTRLRTTPEQHGGGMCSHANTQAARRYPAARHRTDTRSRTDAGRGRQTTCMRRTGRTRACDTHAATAAAPRIDLRDRHETCKRNSQAHSCVRQSTHSRKRPPSGRAACGATARTAMQAERRRNGRSSRPRRNQPRPAARAAARQ